MLVLKVATSKKGNRYTCIACRLGGRDYVLSFDEKLILKILDLTYRQLEDMPYGEYSITDFVKEEK